MANDHTQLLSKHSMNGRIYYKKSFGEAMTIPGWSLSACGICASLLVLFGCRQQPELPPSFTIPRVVGVGLRVANTSPLLTSVEVVIENPSELLAAVRGIDVTVSYNDGAKWHPYTSGVITGGTNLSKERGSFGQSLGITSDVGAAPFEGLESRKEIYVQVEIVAHIAVGSRELTLPARHVTRIITGAAEPARPPITPPSPTPTTPPFASAPR
jgi:hypothetical protein